jgi:hypothetical protein
MSIRTLKCRAEKFIWFIALDVEHSTLTIIQIAQTAVPPYMQPELQQKTDHIHAMNADITTKTVIITVDTGAASVYSLQAYS